MAAFVHEAVASRAADVRLNLPLIGHPDGSSPIAIGQGPGFELRPLMGITSR